MFLTQDRIVKTTNSEITSVCRAFAHVERLFDEAEIKRRLGDEEQAYICFSRMCGISKLILEKTDFSKFKITPVIVFFFDVKFLLHPLGRLVFSFSLKLDSSSFACLFVPFSSAEFYY